MLAYIAKRVILALFTSAAISFLSFVILQLPEGDYVDTVIERLEFEGSPVTLAEAQAMRAYYGIDKPMIVQYWKWISRIVRQLDFGWSYTNNRPVKELITDRLQFTILLTAFTMAVTWVLAIPIGIYSAVRQHTVGDYVFTFIGFTGLAVPDFLLGLLMMWILFDYFDQSVGGLFSGEYQHAPWSIAKVEDLLKHMIVPAVVLGTSGTAGLIRIMRNNLLDELSKPYVVTARAKGLPEWKLILKYPVRLALNPLVSTLGYLLPVLMSGSVIVSVVLSLPTEGPLLLRALLAEDLFVSATIVLLLGALTVIGTLMSDILLGILDPRIRMG